MLPLYVCSTNSGKLREFCLAAEEFHAPFPVEILPAMQQVAPPEETGITFEENARLKALYYSQFTNEPVFADDSGLEVDALGGAPGVYSARFAGAGADDQANNTLLLQRMQGIRNRSARFVCSICLVQAGEVKGNFHGSVEGELLECLRGENGFGYDPLFYYPPFGRTLAECDARQKLAVSHRGRAFQKLLIYMLAAKR